MPNYCDYRLKVKGNKENCNKFLNKLIDYDEPNHFYRIFEADIDEEGEDYLIISGNCAWSIESCCRSGYCDQDLFAVNTKDLNLDLEVWSSETEGCFFQEYYLYKNGECIEEDCVSIDEGYPYWDKDYQSFEDYLADWGFNSDEVSPDDFDEEGEYIASGPNGFEEWGEWHI